MFRILDSEQEIEAAFRFLKERFISAPFRTVSVTIPYYRKDLTVEVRWFPDHQSWIASDPDERMMLGVTEKLPKPGERVALTLEFAIPEGIYRFIQGAFADHKSLEESFRSIAFPRLIDTAELVRTATTFSALFRFILEDAEQRLFTLERYCFKGSIDDWMYIAGPDQLESLAKEYLRHLGQESFFELY
jgi:hypothetical protein